jgi:hypothetical protein
LGKQMISTMAGKAELTCWDKGYEKLEMLPDTRSDTQVLWCRERPQGTFDLLLLLDVLEHISEDHQFLEDTVALNTAPSGVILVTVPCWPWLFGTHDVHLKHRRRYRPQDCRALLVSAGLNILRGGSFFHGPLIARCLSVIGERLGVSRQPPKDLGQWGHGVGVTRLVTWALTLDNRCSELFARWGWPVPGLSYWALCQKKPSSSFPVSTNYIV